MADFVILALIAAYCIFLFVRHEKKKKNGNANGCSGCCGDCSACCGVPYSKIGKDRTKDSHG